VKRKRASRADLEAQAAELVALRGERTIDEWAALISVPYRTYVRYEQGQRRAPDVTMAHARATSRGRSKKKRGA
jgi:hypothetical protein